MMRPLLHLGLSCLLAGCAGGQTGEITELGACRVAIGEVAVDAASEAGPPAAEQLAALTSSLDGPLAWDAPAGGEDPASGAITVTVALSGAPATLVGGEGCERPFLDAPARITVRTEGGALDETFDGVVVLQDTSSAAARARLPLSMVRGGLAIEGVDPARGSLLIELTLMAETLTGQLFVRPGDEEDERRLGAF